MSFSLIVPPLSESTLLSINDVLNGSFSSSSSSALDPSTTILSTSSIISSLPPPTPVQSASIPLLLTNKDVSVHALTGSGKTLSYTIPTFELLRRRTSPCRNTEISALIVVPTRELAKQVHGVMEKFARRREGTNVLLCLGGEGTAKSDLEKFVKEGSDIIVGTPGRVHDVLTRYGTVDCRTLDLLVLDEADGLLGMGFREQLDGILRCLPKMRRTGLFSATMNQEVERIGKVGMRNCVYVNVNVGGKGAGGDGKKETPTSLSNYYQVCPLPEKLSRFSSFLLQHGRSRKMIAFFLTCAEADFVGMFLKKALGAKFDFLEVIHGKLTQGRRTEIMSRYRSARSGVLLCTDVAARGLDVGDIDEVVQFDPPQDPSTFVHRVGRAARAGRKGRSLVFLTDQEGAYVEFLKRRGVEVEEIGEGEDCAAEMVQLEDDLEEGEKETKVKGTKQKATATLTKDGNIRDLLPKLKAMCMSDRDYLEKGTRAFTSWIRGYKEHQLGFIFRWKKVDLGALATSFALLRLPKMPELKDVHDKLKGFTAAPPEVDIHGIKYADKQREKQRQERLKKEMASGGKNAKAIKAERKKADKEMRKKKWEQSQREKGRKIDVKKRGRNERIVDEWEELGEEERMWKRMKRGKISKAEYERWESGGTKAGNKKRKAGDIDEDDGSDEE